MERRNVKAYSLSLLFWDTIALIGVFFLAYLVRVKLDSRPLLYDVYFKEYLIAMAVIIPLWIVLFAILGLYKEDIYRRRLFELGRVVLGSILGILVVIGWEYVTLIYVFPARLMTLYVLFGAMTIILAGREFIRQLRKYNIRHNRSYERIMLIGSNSTARDFYKQATDDLNSGLKIEAFVGPKNLLTKRFKGKSFTKLDRMLHSFDPSRIDTIVQTDMFEDKESNDKIFDYAQINHLNYRFLPGNPEFYTGKSTVDVVYGYPIISISPTPLIGWGAIVKRGFDLFATILTLPIWGTILLLISILQKIFNPGPILYISTRLSQFSKPFNLYKFRSMAWEYCQDDAIETFKKMGRKDLIKEYKKNHKLANDPRVTKFGGFLRKTSLDELPQLINVLKGDISLVGPRPIMPHEVNLSFKRTAVLHSVKSGLTGLWQVSGRSDLSFSDRIDLEIMYVRNWSFWGDIKILLRTVRVVLEGKGAE